MIKSGTSNIRKFQFFETIKDTNLYSSEKDNSENKNTGQNNISINNISISNPGQMNAINGILFINGKVTYKKNEKMTRENLIMKILNNEIIEVYRMFNIFHYDFSIKTFDEKPYFIVVGSNINEFNIKEQQKYFMSTSIKIYDATTFINSKDKTKTELGIETGAEPYPKLLKKQIKLLKRTSDSKLYCDFIESEQFEQYESFQNINAFCMDDDFTYAAVSIDREGILLIYGFPNLLDCNIKDIKIIYLPKIMFGEREVNITNLKFADLTIQNEKKRVIYATTGNSIYYYIWNHDEKKIENLEKDIELKDLNQDRIGAYNCCIAVKGSSLLVGASNDNFIGEYNNLEFGKTWFFEGKKTYVNYFNDYLLFAIIGDTESSIQIYDRNNQKFVHYKSDKKKIIGICHDNNYIYVLYEESFNKKFIIKLKEKNNKEKFETFFAKKFFDDAVLYAENLHLDKQKISEISRKHAEYEYTKGNYEKSIEEYIKTVNYYEPSMVIQKFLEKSKLNYLIKYLEYIVNNNDFKIRDLEDNKNYIILLLHCYIIQEEIHKLKDLLEQKPEYFSKDLIKTVIDACVETENIEMALSLSQQYKMIEVYLQILFTKSYEYEEVIKVIEIPEKYQFNLSIKDKIELYLKFWDYFIKIEDENKEKYTKQYFDSVTHFINENRKEIEKKDIIRLTNAFMESDQYFIEIFDNIDSYNLDYTKEMIHRRIHLHLDEIEKDKKNKNEKKKIIDIIKNDKLSGKYDSQYLIMIFKNKKFLEGIEVLSEIQKYNQDLLSIYMEKKEYEKIINLCKNYGATELSFWGTSLNYFMNEKNSKNLSEEEIDRLNINLEDFLEGLMDSKIILPVNVLDIIYEKNKDIPFNILKNFISKSLVNEIKSIEEEQNNFNEYDKKIEQTVNEIKELKTKACTFNLVKCYECEKQIDIPSIAFKCGHTFHTSCISSNITDDMECPKCKDEKNDVIGELEQYKNIYNKVNTLDNLEKNIDQEENKIKFLYDLYGKGFFDLGFIKEK